MREADGIIGVSERASCPKTGAHPRIKSEDMLFGKRALRSDPRPVSLGKARRIEAWSQDYNHHHLYLKLGWLTPAATAPRCQQKEELNERSSGAFNGDRILSRIKGRWPHDYLRPPIPPLLGCGFLLCELRQATMSVQRPPSLRVPNRLDLAQLIQLN